MGTPLHEQLKQARERAGLTKTALGKAVGWTDHTNVIRVEKGRGTDTSALIRWAEVTEHEILVVPIGSAESVLGRAREANERELRIAAALLDLLVSHRDDPRAADYLERDIVALRERLDALRGMTPTAG